MTVVLYDEKEKKMSIAGTMSQCVGAGGSGTKGFVSSSVPGSLSPTHRPRFEEPRQPKGSVLFTGPDGVSNQRVRVEERKFVGHGTSSPEASGDTQYIMRGAVTNPHPLPKNSKVGEIGWGVPRLSDYSLLKSGNQITLGTFRQRVEDRHTHLYQEPYYPAPESGQKDENMRKSQSGTISTLEDWSESEHKP